MDPLKRAARRRWIAEREAHARRLLAADYDANRDAYASWELAIAELHDRTIAELVADHR